MNVYPVGLLGNQNPFPSSRFASWLRTKPVQSNGDILDESGQLGDRRTMQPKRAVAFDGATQYGTVSIAGSTISAMSGMCWLKTTDTGDATIFGCDSSSSVARGWSLRLDPVTNNLQFFGPNDLTASTYLRYTATTGVNDGNWHLVGFTFNNGAVKLFIDGVEASVSNTSQGTPTTIVGKTLFLIASRDGGGLKLEAKMQDIRLFLGNALSASDFAKVYAAPETIIGTETVFITGDQNNNQLSVNAGSNGNHITWINVPTTYEGKDVPTNRANEIGYSSAYGVDDTLITATKPTGLVDIEFYLKSWETDQFILFCPSTSGTFLMTIEPGSSNTTHGVNTSYTEIYIDEVPSKTLTRGQLHTLLTDGVTRKIRITDVNFSNAAWDVGIYFGGYLTGTWANSKTIISQLKIGGVAYNGPQVIPAINSTTDALGKPLQFKGRNPQDGFCSDHAALVLSTGQYVNGFVISESVNSYSFSCVFQTSQVTNAQFLFDFRDVSDDGLVIRIGPQSEGNKIDIYHNSSGKNLSTFGSYADGQVHQLQVVWDGSTITMTTELETRTVSRTGAINVSIPWKIGARSFSTPEFYVEGKLSSIVFEVNGVRQIDMPCADAESGVARTSVYERVSGTQLSIVNPLSNWGVVPGNIGRHYNQIDGFSDPLKLIGPEMITNGTFDSNINGWTPTRTGTLEWDAGRIKTNNGGTAFAASQELTVVDGQWYKFTATLVAATSSDYKIRATNSSASFVSGTALATSNNIAIGETVTIYFKAIGTVAGIHIGGSNAAGSYGIFDNVSVKSLPAQPGVRIPANIATKPYGEMTTNGSFDSDSWWTKGASTTISGGSAHINNGTTSMALQRDDLVELGKYYDVEIEFSAYTSGQIRVILGSEVTGNIGAASPIWKGRLRSKGTLFKINAQGSFVGSIGRISVKEIVFDDNGDGTDLLGNPLTNPGGAWKNGAESKLNFTKQAKSLPVGKTVPGDGTTAAYGTVLGNVVVGVTNGERKSRFYLEK